MPTATKIQTVEDGPVFLRGRRLWLVAFLGFFLFGAAWATSIPYNGVPDEINHIIRAAGAGRGEFIPEKAAPADGAGAFQTVARSLLKGDMCWQSHSARDASCGAEPGGDESLMRHVHSSAGRYPPVYYAAVGWALVLWPNWTGVIIARLIGVAITAALLAGAAYGAVRWTRNRLLPAGIFVAVTPVTLHLSGGVNPSGVEIAAGVALFVGLASLLVDETPGPPAALTLTGVAAMTLAAVRPFGPLWVAIAIGVVVFPVSRRRLRAVWGNRAGRLWAAALLVVLALGVLWTLLMGTGERGWVNPVNLSPWRALRFELLNRTGEYANQMVGILSWLDIPLPGLSYLVWFMAFGLLVLGAVAVGGRWERLRLLALAAATFGVPVLTDALNARTYGLVAQGRYVLPVAVGLPILAAHALGRRLLVGADAVRVTRTIALLLVPVHLIGLWYALIRWGRGLPVYPHVVSINPFGGNWTPPLGSVVPVVLGLSGALALMAYGWFAGPAERSSPDLGPTAHRSEPRPQLVG